MRGRVLSVDALECRGRGGVVADCAFYRAPALEEPCDGGVFQRVRRDVREIEFDTSRQRQSFGAPACRQKSCVDLSDAPTAPFYHHVAAPAVPATNVREQTARHCDGSAPLFCLDAARWSKVDLTILDFNPPAAAVLLPSQLQDRACPASGVQSKNDKAADMWRGRKQKPGRLLS